MNFFTKKNKQVASCLVLDNWIWVFKNHCKFQSAFGVLHFEKSSNFCKNLPKNQEICTKKFLPILTTTETITILTYILLKFHCRYSSHSDGLPFYLFEIRKKPPSRVFSWNEHISYSLYCCIVRCCNFLHIWRAASNAPHSDLKLKQSMCY